MDSWDLKKWRKRHGFNQFEAAAKLGTNRSGLQDWEREVRPIWKSIELACEEITRLERQKFDFGPVRLVCIAEPFFKASDRAYRVSLLRYENHPNNETAINAACDIDLSLSKAFIMADDGVVIWESDEIAHECKRRKEVK